MALGGFSKVPWVIWTVSSRAKSPIWLAPNVRRNNGLNVKKVLSSLVKTEAHHFRMNKYNVRPPLVSVEKMVLIKPSKARI